MRDIGKAPDHGLPPEVEADPDLETLRCAAELVGRALEKVGGTEVDKAHILALPSLEYAQKVLLWLIQRMEARKERPA